MRFQRGGRSPCAVTLWLWWSWVQMVWTEKGKALFFLQEEPIWCLLYDPRSAGEGWWETREEMGTAGELRSGSPSRDLGQQTWHCPLPLLF